MSTLSVGTTEVRENRGMSASRVLRAGVKSGCFAYSAHPRIIPNRARKEAAQDHRSPPVIPVPHGRGSVDLMKRDYKDFCGTGFQPVAKHGQDGRDTTR